MTRNKSTDEQFMRQALRLARRGLGRTSPNPMVGAVITRGDRIIAQGYHHRFGGDHAEVDAIKHAPENVAGATMYVTLEPCTHHGKTPPCVDAVIRAKLARVVIGTLDPFPEMRGRSLEILKENGIETAVGILEDECRALNEVYLKYTTVGMPFVTIKFAQTLDGRIATSDGNSRWISSPESRQIGHRLRARHDAILVGVGTVLADDPELTTRLVRGRNPVRVVLDSTLRIPLDSKILKDQPAARTLVAATPHADKQKAAALDKMGVEVLTVPADAAGRVDIRKLLKMLAQRQISSVLVEGGGETITTCICTGLADRLVVFVAPMVLGKGTDSVNELNITDLSKAVGLTVERVYRSGGDIVIEAKVKE